MQAIPILIQLSEDAEKVVRWGAAKTMLATCFLESTVLKFSKAGSTRQRKYYCATIAENVKAFSFSMQK